MSRSSARALCLVATLALCVAAHAGDAAIVTVPPGLAPGAGYRLIFVTSTLRNGASANAADYNAFVTSTANAVPQLAALGTTWSAVVQTASVDPRDNTGTNPLPVGGVPTNPGVPFYRLDGAKVANDNTYFWGMAFPLADINITEQGGAAPISVRSPDGSTQPWVWTGVTTGPSVMGSSFPVAAVAQGGGANAWIGLAIANSSNGFPLYAVSGVLHAPQPGPVLPLWVRFALAAALLLLVVTLLRRNGLQRVAPPPR